MTNKMKNAYANCGMIILVLLMLNCTVILLGGCGNDINFPGASSAHDGGTTNNSVSNVNSFNPVTTNNGVVTMGCEVSQTIDPNTGEVTFEGKCTQVDPITGATTAVLSGPDPVTALTSQCCQQPVSSSSLSSVTP